MRPPLVTGRWDFFLAKIIRFPCESYQNLAGERVISENDFEKGIYAILYQILNKVPITCPYLR